jgi:ferredoxin
MKIKIDAAKCTGHGRCWEYAREVYELDDNGYNLLRGKVLEVAPDKEAAARLGASNCPECAIEIVES